MAIIYTNNSSGAIRRLRAKKTYEELPVGFAKTYQMVEVKRV